MKRKKNDVKDLPFRYFLTLFVVFSLVLLASYVPIYRYFNQGIVQNFKEHYQSSLSNSILQLDTTLKTLDNANVVTAEDSRFRTLKYTMLPETIDLIEFSGLTNLLNGLVVSHDMIYDTAILFSQDVVLTRTRCFYKSNYFNYYPSFLQCAELTYDQWFALLSDADILLPVMIYRSTDYGTYEAITYAQNWSLSSDMYFISTIPTASIQELVLGDLSPEDAYIRVTGRNGETLYEHGEITENTMTMISAGTSQQITVELGISNQILLENTAPVRRMVFIYLISIIVLTFIMVVFFTRRSVMPIKQILDVVHFSNHLGKSYTEKFRNSSIASHKVQRTCSALEKSVLDLDLQMDDYQQTIDTQRNELRMQMMNMAIQGQLNREEDMQRFRKVFPDFPGEYKLVLIYYRADNPQRENELREHIVKALMDTYKNSYAQYHSYDAVLLLLPCNTDCHAQDDNLHELRKLLTYGFDISVRILQSHVTSAPENLRYAYEQIQCLHTATAYRKQTDEILNESLIRLPLTIDEVQQLYVALNRGNAQAAKDILSRCMAQLPTLPDHMMYYHTYTMIAQMLVQIKMENPSVLFNVVIPTFDKNNMPAVFKTDFPACFERIATIYGANNSSLATEVMDYIDHNICNADLCVQMVSDHFSISAPKLQRMVRSVVAKTFSGYVESTRMKMAYIMLSKGEQVNTVATNCGFSSANSFFKAFKRNYNVSPSSIHCYEPQDAMAGEP